MEKEFRNYIEAEKKIKAYCQAIMQIGAEYGWTLEATMDKPRAATWSVTIKDVENDEYLFEFQSTNPDLVSAITYTWFDGFRIGLRPF